MFSCVLLLQFSPQKVADVSVLASWYCEAENFDQPIIIIIDDLEQCSGDVLGELVMMMRYYAPQHPCIFSITLVYASIFHADPNINKYKQELSIGSTHQPIPLR